MTGTPRPFEEIAEIDFPEDKIQTRILFDECKNVVPQNVVIIDKLTAMNKMKTLLSEGKKIIYFSNHTMTEGAVRTKFEIGDDINISVSFSSDEKRKLLSEDEKKKMNETEESLANISRIPEYVQLFVTTSKNKEGINIHNDDFRNMFVETHLMYDAVQMAGRVRVGLENLYIISDAEPINNYGNPVDIPFSKEILVKNKDSENSADEVNKFLIKYLESIKKTTPEKDERRRRIMNYVNYIEEKFPYVRYNVFKDEFEFFHTKEKAEKMVLRENEKFKKAVATRDHSYIREWFPYSEVKNELSVQAQAYTYLKNLIGINKYVILTTDELKLYLSRIREWFNSKLTSPNSILHLVDKNFNCEKLTNRYKLYYGKESPKIKGTAMKKHHK